MAISVSYNRNKYCLSKMITDYQPMFIFLQEHLLPNYQASAILSKDLQNYNFSMTSSDSFTTSEDIMQESGTNLLAKHEW
jgi:hypothetical protein